MAELTQRTISDLFTRAKWDKISGPGLFEAIVKKYEDQHTSQEDRELIVGEVCRIAEMEVIVSLPKNGAKELRASRMALIHQYPRLRQAYTQGVQAGKLFLRRYERGLKKS